MSEVESGERRFIAGGPVEVGPVRCLQPPVVGYVLTCHSTLSFYSFYLLTLEICLLVVELSTHFFFVQSYQNQIVVLRIMYLQV